MSFILNAFWVAIVVAFFSCNNADEVRSSPVVAASSSPSKTGSAEKKIIDSIVYDEYIYPCDTTYPARLLVPGNFHEDEVEENAAKEKWMGVFKCRKSYYVAKAAIETSRINDIVDEPDQQTGWHVKVLHADTALFIVSGIDLAPGKVRDIQFPEYVWPGDSVVFEYNGKGYKLFAKGNKELASTGWYNVWNYKLYLTRVEAGKENTELLVSQPNFSDAMTSVLFVGDVDGDGYIDLLLDTSRHYNMQSHTLYLTKPAEDGKIFKVVARHITTGC
ncbi:MAG: hypothetical protein ACKOXB_04770 [Flavobacteriales bacterium]